MQGPQEGSPCGGTRPQRGLRKVRQGLGPSRFRGTLRGKHGAQGLTAFLEGASHRLFATRGSEKMPGLLDAQVIPLSRECLDGWFVGRFWLDVESHLAFDIVVHHGTFGAMDTDVIAVILRDQRTVDLAER